MKSFYKLGIVVFLLLLILFGNFLIFPKSFLAFKFKEAINLPFIFLKTVVYNARIYKELNKLAIENQNLRARLFEFSQLPQSQILNNRRYVIAKVYSTYPFNTRDEIMINAGKSSGIQEALTATIGGDLLLGKIISINNYTSIIRTIFDSKWQFPVKIGDQGVDALYIGAKEPRLTMIDRDKKITVGDVVYSTGREFPFGLKIGEIIEIKSDSSQVFNEAKIKLNYNPDKLEEVWLILK